MHIIFLLNLKIVKRNKLIAFYLGNNKNAAANIVSRHSYNKCNSNIKN